MITARFSGSADDIRAVSISGHAGYADSGYDIACASVTSAVQLTANAISEVLKAPAQVQVLENSISIALKQPDQRAGAFLSALHLHLELLSEEFPGAIKVIISEV